MPSVHWLVFVFLPCVLVLPCLTSGELHIFVANSSVISCGGSISYVFPYPTPENQLWSPIVIVDNRELIFISLHSHFLYEHVREVDCKLIYFWRHSTYNRSGKVRIYENKTNFIAFPVNNSHLLLFNNKWCGPENHFISKRAFWKKKKNRLKSLILCWIMSFWISKTEKVDIEKIEFRVKELHF